MEHIGIIGLGLMGSSLALALKKYYPGVIIAGNDKKRACLEFNLAKRTINQELSLENLGEMAIIFIATPVNSTIQVLDEISPKINWQETIVTDLGSTKAEICRYVKEKYPDLMFIGGHPMTGKESSGPNAAEADLFLNKSYILTSGSDRSIGEKITPLLKKIGARIVFLDPAEHDKMVGITSHLPQLLATALVNKLFENKEHFPEIKELIGPGFLDLTRIAASNPRMWSDIYISNRTNLVKAIDQMLTELKQCRDLIKAGNEQGIFRFMDKGRERQLELRGGNSDGNED